MTLFLPYPPLTWLSVSAIDVSDGDDATVMLLPLGLGAIFHTLESRHNVCRAVRFP